VQSYNNPSLEDFFVFVIKPQTHGKPKNISPTSPNLHYLNFFSEKQVNPFILSKTSLCSPRSPRSKTRVNPGKSLVGYLSHGVNLCPCRHVLVAKKAHFWPASQMESGFDGTRRLRTKLPQKLASSKDSDKDAKAG